MSDTDEFYIGYEAGMPTAMRRVVRFAVIIAIGGAAAAAGLFVASQRSLAESRFEFGVVRPFEGFLALAPAPVLLVQEQDAVRPHWLVGRGKFGAAEALGDVPSGWVSLSGTLIEREPWRMIEVVAGSVRPRGGAPPQPAMAETRHVVLRGEIVDSKCYLGVMNPGERTVHRDCAVRCLAGGIPAMFAYRDDTGAHLALLLGADAQLRRDGVGRPITLSGLLSGPEEALVFAIGGAW